MISDTISHVGLNEPMIQRTFGGGPLGGRQQSLEAPGFTPWFDIWTKFTLNSIPTGTSDHEFLRYHLGCIFVISSGAKNPVEQLQVLCQQQYRHQHEKGGAISNGNGGIYPQYLCTNILKYYIVIHDAFEVDDSSAQEMFIKVQNAFGSGFCHLLSINSRTGQMIQSSKESDQTANLEHGNSTGNPGVADFWINHMESHRFCNVETRLASISGESTKDNKLSNNKTKIVNSNISSVEIKAGMNDTSKSREERESSHPLADTESNESSDFVDVDALVKGEIDCGIKASNKLPNLVPVTACNIALLLNSNDIDRIRAFIKEFIVKALIPYLEKQMRTLHEIVTNRKSRSLFSGAKKWFSGAAASAGNKAGAGSLLGGSGVNSGMGGGTSVIYAREAPELQMRRLGDIYFMLKLYKLAYSCYHTSKRDFQSDEVWNYYAGAAEMAALSQFMQGTTANPSEGSKTTGSLAVGGVSNNIPAKYPAHYIEDAITKYLSVCQMPEFALRATLFDAICFKHQGLFQEAANAFIRMTNEAKDLRSALLLEQAAYCYLLAPAPLVRKYAFHIILAGFRFSKSGQKFHSSRTYRQGFQIYKGHGWSLSEDHILYNLGHQSLLLKDHYTAANLYNELLSNTSARSNPVSIKNSVFTFGGASKSQANTNPIQQMCHLREFFIVHHMREKEDKKVVPITIPSFLTQDSILDLTGSYKNDHTNSSSENKQRYNPNQSSYENLKRISGEIFADLREQPPRLELERVVEERISAQEALMTQTCQTIFGPNSDNTLPPQGMIGERIRMIIPAKNVFQTPLLLKKIHLIWKFTAVDTNAKSGLSMNKIESDESDNTTEATTVYSEKIASSEAEKYIATDLVDSVIIPSEDTVLIDVGLVPKQEGSLVILGIQYSIKAQFQQSEPTDYTIQGRQYLKAQGQRLTQTKDQRTSKDPVYNKDIRIGHPIEIFPCNDLALPNLGIEIVGVPDEIHQGETRKLNLNITNLSTDGPCASVNKVYLISNKPGIFAKHKDNQSHSVQDKSMGGGDILESLPFDFPVIADPALSVSKDGVTQDVSLDILPIELDDNISSYPKNNKRTLNLPIWFCGPNSLGRNNFTIYFYYESNIKVKRTFNKRRPLQYRMIRVDLSNVVLPSLSLSALRSPACIHENDLSQAILVKVKNDADANHSTSMDSIKISQISLVSGNNYALKEILSSSKKDAIICKGESNVFCIKTVCRSLKPEGSKFDDYNTNIGTTSERSQFCVSQIYLLGNDSGGDRKTGAIVSLKNSTSISFIKNGFKFYETSKLTNTVKGMELKKDLLLISWQGMKGKTKLSGQLFVSVEEEDVNDTTDSRNESNVSNTTFKTNTSISNNTTTTNVNSNISDSECGDTINTIPTPKLPCNISIQIGNMIKHNFQQSPVATIPFSVYVQNCASVPTSFYYKTDKDSAANFEDGNHKILGCTNSLLRMKSGESLTIPFQVIVTKPGVYNFNCLRFQHGVGSETENIYDSTQNQSEKMSPPVFDEDDLIPLRLSFIVTHASNDP